MSKIRNDGMQKVWFSTGLFGTKSTHFKSNPKASVCCQQGDDSVTLIGDVRVCTDLETRKEFWQDWFINHFPGGIEDESYCVIEFCAREATFWIDREFVTLGADDIG